MATPVFDVLSEELARRLGDQYQPGTGNVVTAADDGIAYSALDRADFLTWALRQLITLLGGRWLDSSGFRETYVTQTLTNTETTQFPDGTERVLYVDFYGTEMVQATMRQLKRRSNIYWQRVPMWRVIAREVVFLGIRKAPFEATIYFQNEIAPVYHDGPVDIAIDYAFQPMLMALAESFGRRTHQELGPMFRNEALAEIKEMKES